MAIWILLIGLFATSVVTVLAYHFANRWLALLAVLIVIGTVAGMMIDIAVETDQERIKRVVRELASAVASNDIEQSLALVSQKAPLCRQAISSEMPTYQFRTCYVIAYDEVRFEEHDPRSASIIFRVGVDVSAPSYQYNGFATRDVKLFFRKEADDVWRVVGYRHRSPSNQDWNDVGEIGPGPEVESGF